MSGEQRDKETGQSQPSSSEAWQEVGRQFQLLGESLAAAWRASWNREENRQRMQAIQGGIEAMVKEIDHAIEETMQSPQGQQARVEAQKVAESLRQAGEQTVQEIRPHLLAALQQVNEELRKMTSRMEQSEPDKKTDE